MATIHLIGGDAPLLEGLSQTLAAAGHAPRIATGVPEAFEQARSEPALVAVLDRTLAADDASAIRLPLATGGAIILYHSPSDAGAATLAPALQRATMADLALPLERHRLVALIQRVEARALATGRGRMETPPEQRAQ